MIRWGSSPAENSLFLAYESMVQITVKPAFMADNKEKLNSQTFHRNIETSKHRNIEKERERERERKRERK